MAKGKLEMNKKSASATVEKLKYVALYDIAELGILQGQTVEMPEAVALSLNGRVIPVIKPVIKPVD